MCCLVVALSGWKIPKTKQNLGLESCCTSERRRCTLCQTSLRVLWCSCLWTHRGVILETYILRTLSMGHLPAGVMQTQMSCDHHGQPYFNNQMFIGPWHMTKFVPQGSTVHAHTLSIPASCHFYHYKQAGRTLSQAPSCFYCPCDRHVPDFVKRWKSVLIKTGNAYTTIRACEPGTLSCMIP